MGQDKGLISDELLQKVEEAAREQNGEPAELVSEALRKYLDEQTWVQFVERNGDRARKRGIGEEDVDRLVSEVRQETSR